MSSFCDRLLKSGGDKMSEAETEAYLTKLVKLFSYLEDKDLFGEIFRNQLAKRLLNSKSASDDMEKTMISKLKADVGAQFTSKMEGMMNDLTTGLEHKKKFDDFHSKCEKTSPINFSVQVRRGRSRRADEGGGTGRGAFDKGELGKEGGSCYVLERFGKS